MGPGAIIGIAVGFIFALIGVILLVVAIVSRNKANKAKSWPTAQGRVVSSEVRVHQDYDAEDGHSSTNYEPVVQYAFDVNGVPYTAARIGYGANQFDHNTAQNKANRYMTGSSVVVHYDPADPRNAVLETEAGGAKIFLIVGIIFAGLGLTACCVGGIVGFLSQMASSTP